MKSILSFTLFCLCFLICASQEGAESESMSYCKTYFANDLNMCLSIMSVIPWHYVISQSSEAFQENLEVIKENNERNDMSITVSFYAMYERDFFEENMTLNSQPFESIGKGTSTPSGGDVGGGETEGKECKFMQNFPDVDRSYPGLDESINVNVMQYKSYVLSGILDLLYTAYKDYRPSFDLRFSVSMLEQIIGVDATIEQALEYLEDSGVCTSVDYEEEVKSGRPLKPTCHRFRIKSYTQLRGLDSCQIAEKLYGHPLYAQVAINPYYFQLYSITASQPIRYSYTRFTVAGVFTGYKWQDDFPYWIISVRRHDAESNRIHLKLNINNLFGNMGSKLFEVVANLKDYDDYQEKMQCNICYVNELVNMSVNCTHLTILSNCLNDVVIAFNLNAYPRLQNIEVKEWSLRKSPALILNGLLMLRNVKILRNSFTEMTTSEVPNTVFSKNKRVVLKNLPRLESFSSEENAFSDFIQFNSADLPELTTLSFGVSTADLSDYSNSFYWASQLKLTKLPKLKTLVIGNYGFSGVDFFTLSELQSLESVNFGYGAFYGYSSNCAVDSRVTFENVNRLQSIILHENSMNMFKEIVIQNIPSATTVEFGSHAWDCLNAIRIHGNLESNIHVVTAVCAARSSLGVFVNNGNVRSCKQALQQ